VIPISFVVPFTVATSGPPVSPVHPPGSETLCPVCHHGSKASFDEIALFNSALDATAISRHYAAGRELLP
jgi:hypothetical protein